MADIADEVAKAMRRRGQAAVRADSVAKACDLLRSGASLALLNVDISEFPALHVLTFLKKLCRNCRVIVATASSSKENMMGLMEAGASVVFRKPVSVRLLLREIERILKLV